MSQKSPKISAATRLLSASALLLSCSFMVSANANAQGVAVYKGGHKVTNTSSRIEANKSTNGVYRINRSKASSNAANTPDLLGASGEKTQDRRRKPKIIQCCNAKTGQIRVFRGSQIVYVPNRKN